MAEAGRAITFLEEGFFFDNLTRTLSISIIMYNPVCHPPLTDRVVCLCARLRVRVRVRVSVCVCV
eukprot:3932152-Rhodomonas_salina.3